MIKSFLQSRLLQAIAQQQGKITAADVKFAKMVVATAFLDSGGVVPEPGTSFDIMQITDAQEEAELNAELSRMEGGMAAASARAQGTASLISGLGDAAKFGYEAGLIGGD